MKNKPDIENLEFKTQDELDDIIEWAKNEIEEYRKFIRICENWKRKLKEINEKRSKNHKKD